MARETTHFVGFRRKREGKTNYKRRLALLKGGIPRLVVRKTNQQIIAQIVSYSPDGDKVISAANSIGLKKLGWKYSCKNIPAAYALGCVLGSKAKGKVDEVILDVGLHVPLKGSRLFAVAKGVSESVKVRIDDDAFPVAERLDGVHIASYHKSAPASFTGYAKASADPSSMKAEVARIKKSVGVA